MKDLITINFIFYFLSFTTGSRVLELSDRFLDIRKEDAAAGGGGGGGGVWLVKFYAPWCGHCKKLEPIYSHVAQALHDTPVRVARVDCTRFPAVGKEFGVQGFPTIMFIKPTTSHTYTGDRTSADIISYARKMMGPAVREYSELDEEDFMLYEGRKAGELWEAFDAVAEANQHDFGFFYDLKENDRAVITLHHPSTPQLPYNSPSPPPTNHTHNLQTFLTSNKFRKYPKITPSNFHDLLATGKLIALAVVEEDKLGRVMAGAEVEFLKVFEEWVGMDHNDEGLQFGWTATPSLANSIAMTTLPLPTLLLINSSTHTHHILPENSPITLSTLSTFLTLAKTNQLPSYGGSSLPTRLYRSYYTLTTSLSQMFAANPVLTSLMFGLPLGFLSLIFYSICCSEILDEEIEEEDEQPHEKRE